MILIYYSYLIFELRVFILDYIVLYSISLLLNLVINVDIDGCVSIQCRGSCTDVPYNHPLITMNPDSNGTEAICEECPHGTVWSTVGKDGCQGV